MYFAFSFAKNSASYFLLIYLFLFISNTAKAQTFYVDYNTEAREIYKSIIDLKLNEVPLKIRHYKSKHPYNLASIHLDNYLDFFTLFVGEEIKEFEKREKEKKRRINIIERTLSDNDPYKRFLKAEINLQWALTRSKFGELFSASREIYTAYNLLTENNELFPDFIYNKKSLSILHSLVETITLPGIVKNILGLEGSISLAKKEINEVIVFSNQSEFFFKEEADAINAFVLFYQANEKQKAWNFLKESSLNPNESLLALFLVSKIAQRIGQNDFAIQILENQPIDSSYSQFHYLEYQLGLAKLRKLDPASIRHLENFVNKFKGRHFIKEAYQKLAWAALIFHNDVDGYNHYMTLLNSKGDNLVDDDKQAMRESQSKLKPNIILLKARLLFDGGYYSEADELLSKNKDLFFKQSLDHSEYNYRQGRIAQELGNDEKALESFRYTLDNTTVSKTYFACNAALQIGLIYEKLGNTEFAKDAFRRCLSIQPKSYKQSLHQKAKSGLERIVK